MSTTVRTTYGVIPLEGEHTEDIEDYDEALTLAKRLAAETGKRVFINSKEVMTSLSCEVVTPPQVS